MIETPKKTTKNIRIATRNFNKIKKEYIKTLG